jgi:uncharacterized repeat protein (TIGR03803 family)
MRLSSFGAIFYFAAIVAVFAGCSNSPQSAQVLPTAPTIARDTGGGQPRYGSSRRLSLTERLIYSFGAAGSGDGYQPEAALYDLNGSLYGVTPFGGGPHGSGSGTVFKIKLSGKEQRRTFWGANGAFPVGDLINVNGRFYGTTFFGGANGSGIVFSITPGGKRTTVYDFGRYGGPDGNYPNGGLTDINGTLYGTTTYGGTYGGGTVYSVTTTGHETVLYSFGADGDGYMPTANLIDINRTLYGTTQYGGTYNEGTVFSVTTSGSEKVLHSFSGPPDGFFPYAGLTSVNGTIYGTTVAGGSMTCQCGIVFSINASGNEKVLHTFTGPPDGALPEASLLNVNGTLYGTTTGGGAYSNGSVFTITTSGQEAVLYDFKGHPDGAAPRSGLIDVKGTLYGTTFYGGAYTGECRSSVGCGTVFSIIPRR